MSPTTQSLNLANQRNTAQRVARGCPLNVRQQFMTRLIGRFYFKKTANGNLIGEYSNRAPASSRSYAEAATRIEGGNEWVGDYMTTWCEAPKNECVSARLEIEAKPNCIGIFILRWRPASEPNGKAMFAGEAMLCDDMIVGDYTNG